MSFALRIANMIMIMIHAVPSPSTIPSNRVPGNGGATRPSVWLGNSCQPLPTKARVRRERSRSHCFPRVTDESLDGYQGLVTHVRVVVRHQLHHARLRTQVCDDSACPTGLTRALCV